MKNFEKEINRIDLVSEQKVNKCNNCNEIHGTVL